MKSYAIIGMGRFGHYLAESLYNLGNDVLAIDINDDLVNAMGDHVSRAVCADAKDPEVLKQLDIADYDAVIVALASDLGSSVLITMNLKTLGAKSVICKAYDDTHVAILKKLGADRVIIPERAIAEELATTLTTPNILDHFSLSDDCDVIEMSMPVSWIGKTLKKLNVQQTYGLTVIAIKDKNGVILTPSPDMELQKDLILIILGDVDAITEAKKIV